MNLYTSGDIKSVTVEDLINVAKEERLEISMRHVSISDSIIFSVSDADKVITFNCRVPLADLENKRLSFIDIFGALMEKVRVARMEVRGRRCVFDDTEEKET